MAAYQSNPRVNMKEAHAAKAETLINKMLMIVLNFNI